MKACVQFITIASMATQKAFFLVNVTQKSNYREVSWQMAPMRMNDFLRECPMLTLSAIRPYSSFSDHGMLAMTMYDWA